MKSSYLAIFGMLIATAAGPATAGCYTSDPACSGVATFQNTLPVTNCVSVRSARSAFNFCVPGNGSVDKAVPALSRSCWSGGNFARPADCNIQWIYVPNPAPRSGRSTG